MPRKRLRKKIFWAIVAAYFSVCLESAPEVYAQQLSIRHYDVSDGLAHSHVTAMHQDAKGYLWLATWEGLSRFDGYHFTNYTQRDGLGDPIVNDIGEDRLGRIWVATNGGGVARQNDDDHPGVITGKRPPKFISFRVSDSARSNRVNALLFDSQNNLWCATDGGLFRATEQNGGLNFQLVISYEGETGMVAYADRQGRLWFGIDKQLIQVNGNQIVKYGPEDEVCHDQISSIVEDRKGHLIVANQTAVYELLESPDGARANWSRLPLTFKSDQGINVVLSDSAGALWIGTWNGLVKYVGEKQTLYTNAQGLSANNISSLAEDQDLNLWIGTVGGGVCKLSNELIVSFTRAEGLPNLDIRKIMEDRAGNIYASIENGGLTKILEGQVELVRGSQVRPFLNLNERIIQDTRGDWWIGTDAGLFRFQGPSLQLQRGQKLTSRNGLSEVAMGIPYLDPGGKVWVSPRELGLFSFDPSQMGVSFRQLVPPSNTTLFREAQKAISDHGGTLWLGGHEWLGRLVNNELVMLAATEGLPETRPRAFFVDSRGWLWIGLRYKGVSVTKNSADATPQFMNYSTANGLASDSVWTISEDNSGRMYFGTGKGLDQFDLATGRIRHFNTDDGLPSDIINDCFKDRVGNIWVGTTLGLSRFNPQADRTASQPAPVYLSHIQIAGEDLSLPEDGARTVPQIEISASRNNLTIEYVALSFQGENELRYEYKLDGVDKDWSAPSDTRSINYARLAPGSYQFLVRAINQNGTVTPEPASFQFRILPPIWQRWWFMALAALLIGLIMYALYRQRLARLLELERVRTRIATDLHDDIGANLSLIAMLSEVTRGQLPNGDSRLREWLNTIAATSRDTVDSMSDIVWAVNPKRDNLRDLTRRMRRFADDIFAARNIEFQFLAPELDRDIRLGADLRREVFLIFKETINNAVRHSECSSATASLRVEAGALMLVVSDDGKGMVIDGPGEGLGLASLRSRAERMGGTFEVVSHDHEGTKVMLGIPLDYRDRL